MKFSIKFLLLMMAVVATWVAYCLAAPWGQLSGRFVDAQQAGVENVWVVLVPDDVATLPIHRSLAARKKQPVVVTVDGTGCSHRFVHVQTGQILRVVNNDTVGRSIYPQLFSWEGSSNIPPSDSWDFTANESDKVPGFLRDGLNANFKIPLSVTEHPYVTSTDANGEFMFEHVPKGEWTFRFWHPDLGYLRNIKIGGETSGRRGDVVIDVRGFFTTNLGTTVIRDEGLAR